MTASDHAQPNQLDQNSAASASTSRLWSISSRFSTTPPLAFAAVQWLVVGAMVLIMLGTPVLSGRNGMMNLTESWGALERVAMWQRSFSWFPGVELNGGAWRLPVPAIVWSVRLLLIALFALHIFVFAAAWSGPQRSAWKWLIGPIGSGILYLGFVPSNADIFFYEMSGDVANNGSNPYTHYLYEFTTNPLLPYNHWVDMTTVYGPFWTDVNRLIMGITGPDPYIATIVYKVMLGVVAIGLAGLVYWLTKRLTNSVRLATAAMVFVAWQPNILLESAGQAHNDIVVAFISTFGIALALIGGMSALRGAIVLVTLSATVKYVSLPLVGVLALLRLTEFRLSKSVRKLLQSWILDGIAILAVVVATFAPYWAGASTFREMFLEPGRLFAHPIWLVPYLVMSQFAPGGVVSFYVDTMRTVLQIATFALLGVAVYSFVRSLWTPAPDVDIRSTESQPWWSGHLIKVWVSIFAILALVPVNSHSWYWTWTVAPIAVLVAWNHRGASSDTRNTPETRWLVPYMFLIATMTLIYHTRVVQH